MDRQTGEEVHNAAHNPSFERIILNLPPENSLAIPLLRDFAFPPGVILRQRLDRRYRRLCFVQEELKALAEKGRNTHAGGSSTVSFEDFVFSNMDFSRYAKIPGADFDFFLQSIPDFDRGFFVKNFRIDPVETEALIRKEYKKIDAFYCLARPNPLILSIMRSMETSLEFVPLVREEEIMNELNILYNFLNTRRLPQDVLPQSGTDQKDREIFTLQTIGPFFNFLINRLDGLCMVHYDKSETKLFLNQQGSLSGTFVPRNKPWTLTLAESGA